MVLPHAQPPPRQRPQWGGTYRGLGGRGESPAADRGGRSVHTLVRHTTGILAVVNNVNSNYYIIVIEQVPYFPPFFPPYFLLYPSFSSHFPPFSLLPLIHITTVLHTSHTHPFTPHTHFRAFALDNYTGDYIASPGASPGASPSPFDFSSSLLFSFHGHAASHVKKHR